MPPSSSCKNFLIEHKKKLGLSIVSLLISTAILVIYSPFGYENFAVASAVSWTGGGDGSSWSDGANWSSSSVPGANDDVTITGSTTVNIAAGTTINSLTLGNGSDATALNFAYDASTSPLIIDEGNLIATANSSITHGSGTGTIYINVQTGSITMLGTIDASGKGGSGGAAGANGGGISEGIGIHEADGAGGGGGHGGAGGVGGTSGATGGSTYGSETAPIAIGSGGAGGTGASTTGGAGGGIIRLNAKGDITVGGGGISVQGNIGTATSGNTKSCGGGGSGGSIYITTTGILTINNSTSINAGGGAGGACTGLITKGGGGGGGGRLSLSYVTISNNGTITASGKPGGFGSLASGSAGSDGSIYQYQYAVPSQPSIAGPLNGVFLVSRTPTASSSIFSGDATHTASDWEISTASDDFTGTNLVAYKYNDTTNLTSIIVNSTNFTFQNALAGKTELGPFTLYYIRVRHKNAAGYSSYSSGTHSFTTTPNVVPGTPSIISPSSGATGQSRTLTLTASAFSDEDPDDTHAESTWQIATDTDFTNLVARAPSNTSYLTSIIVNSTNFIFQNALLTKTQLAASTTYYARVGYADTSGGASSFSPTVSFTTQANQNPNTPSITSPTEGATNQAINLTLTSTFSDADPDDTHQSSDWEIYTTATPNADYLDAYVYSATMNKSSIGVNSSNLTFANSLAGQYALDVNTTYYARTRHKGSSNGQSEWSNLVSFTTGTNMAPLKPSIASPASGSTGIDINPTITSSAFSDTNSNDVHTASQWEIYSAPNTISQNRVWYTPSDSVNLTSIIANTTNGTFENGLSGRTKLLPGALYYARVLHMDSASANSEWAIPSSFTTVSAPADPTLSSLSHPSETDLFESATPSFTITAGSPTPAHYHYLINQTAQPTKLTVEAGTELSGSTLTVPAGTITETGTWYVHLIAHDANHNPSENFDTYTIKYDPAAPKITNIVLSNVTETTATVSWTTGNASNSQMNYGTASGNYTQTGQNTAGVTAHQISLSNLGAGTLYYFTVTSQDAYGQTDTSAEQTWRTRSTVAGGSSAGSTSTGSTSSTDSSPSSDADSNKNSDAKTDATKKSTTDAKTKKSDTVKTKKTILGENGSYPKKTQETPVTQETSPQETSDISSGSSQTTANETPTTVTETKTETVAKTTETTSSAGGSILTEASNEKPDTSNEQPQAETVETKIEPTAFETILSAITSTNDTQTTQETTSQETCSAENSEEDRDADGLSDMLECYLGTDPRNRDTDADGITDGEEVLEYNTNAVNNDSTPRIEEIIKPSITNLFKGTLLIADNTPLIQGTAKPLSTLTFILLNKNGDRYIAGKKITEKEGKFLFEFPALLDGEYIIIIEQKDAETHEIIAVSDPVPMSIQTDIAFKAPEIESLSGEKITGNTEKRLITSERRPKIIIKNPMPGGIIMAHWQSAIFASAILADSLDQTVAISPPKALELGDHSVWVYAINPNSNQRSEDAKLEFTINAKETRGKLMAWETLKENAPLVAIPLLAIAISLMMHAKKRRGKNILPKNHKNWNEKRKPHNHS